MNPWAYSGNVYDAAAAGTTNFPLVANSGNEIRYLKRSHIHVYLSDDQGKNWNELAPDGFSFNAEGTEVVLAEGITEGQWVRLQRLTPYGQLYIEFQSSSQFTASQLNTGEDFSMFVDQELHDWLSAITGNGKPGDLIDIGDLGDVEITEPVEDKQALIYDGEDQQFKNEYVGLDSIDKDDVLTSEQMSQGQTFPQWTDSKLSTAGAQKKFFQPLISEIQPSSSEIYEPGKFWYQRYITNLGKEVQSFNIYDGFQWQNIAQGEVIPVPFQPESIIYVDPQGNDKNPGRQPDEAYRTIGAALADANTEIPSTLSTVTAAVYNNETGFVTFTTAAAHNLLTGYTVDVSPITWTCPSSGGNTAQFPGTTTQFRVGSVLASNEVRIYVGPSTIEHVYQSGGTIQPQDARVGDGYTIQCAPGVYHEKLPLVVEAKNLAVIGSSLRNTYIHPDIYTSASSATSGIPPYESSDRVLMPVVGQQGDVDIYQQELETMWLLDSGSYLTGMTFAGLKSLGLRGQGGIDPDQEYGLPGQQSWTAAHRQDAFITKSPYIQNCTHFSDLQTNNANFDINFLAGEGGDTTSGPAGGGILVDGARVNRTSPLRSFVVDSYTQISLGGPGVLATNNGYAQLVSFFGTFCWYHAKSLNGGQLNLSNCTSDFGQYSLIAAGKSANSIFSGGLTTDTAIGSQFISVGSFSRGTQWEAPRAMAPGDHMVVRVGNYVYPILSSTKVPDSDTYQINIFAPKSDESSVPLPELAKNVINADYDNVTGFVTITTDGNHGLLAGRTAFISPITWSCTSGGVDNAPGEANFPDVETEYVIRDVLGTNTFTIYVGPNDKPHEYVSGGIVTPTDINPDTFENGGLKESMTEGALCQFYLQSYISTGGHTMEFVGSGTDYRAHPDFGGVPNPQNQSVEIGGEGGQGSRLAYLNGGRVWLSSTDENGNFKVGETFVVNQKTGSIYILPEAVKSTLKLTDNLDLRGFKIWQDPATAGANTDLQLEPSGTGRMVFGTNDFNSDGERLRPAPVMAPLMEQIPNEFEAIQYADLNKSDPVITQDNVGYDADEIPLAGMLGRLAFRDSPPSVGIVDSPPEPGEIVFQLSDDATQLTIKATKDGINFTSTTLTLS